MNVTACLVTRGDVDLIPILESLPEEWEVSIWDNSVGIDLGVIGRYVAIRCASTEIVYVQDDDCLLQPEAFEMLLDAYHWRRLAVNMPEPFRAHYDDSCLIGFGAIFDRSLCDLAFKRMNFRPPGFERTCDVFFTALTPNQIWLDLPYVNLPYAMDDSRMYRQPGHVAERAAALELARRWR